MTTMARDKGHAAPAGETVSTSEPTPEALAGNRVTGLVTYQVGSSASPSGRSHKTSPASGSPGTKRPGSPTSERDRAAGVEIRVHGIGDHATYSALGTPNYKELVDSRVWIGRLPSLPAHKLRLVNWSRANRQITRHLSWYLAFPFTLLNVAGYMEPKEGPPRHAMRVGIGIASICLTIAMASWIAVITETAWRAVTADDDRLTVIVLQVLGPSLLIVFIVYRMIVGRALVDKGGTMISVLSIGALASLILYLHSKPASRTTGPFHDIFAGGSKENAVDPMMTIVGLTTVIVWIIALALCAFGIRKGRAGAGFAGAAVLLVLAVSLLHTAGSMLRLFAACVANLLPSNPERAVVHSAPSQVDFIEPIRNVLLPKPDDLYSTEKVVVTIGNALRIDLIPVFFLVMVIVFGGLLWIELWWRRRERTNDCETCVDPLRVNRSRRTKPPTRTHVLVAKLPEHLAPAVIVAMLATAAVWVAMIFWFAEVPGQFVGQLLVVLKILGAVAIVMIILRRPSTLAERLRRTFGSVADIAGFWAPDLHPLAGASYRRALLSGIRQAINDLVLDYPDDPIALVGHSQGSVVCAWFVRGGHWTERRAEGMTDRQALKIKLYDVDRKPSNRIALYTCGSPLHSLYATFFPRYFDPDFFETTRHMTCQGSRWRNYWRKTDPIGMPLPEIRDRDNVDVTELADEETLGHSEYWREERLRADITRFFETTPVRERKESTLANS
jgi:hypothetical protein